MKRYYHCNCPASMDAAGKFKCQICGTYNIKEKAMVKEICGMCYHWKRHSGLDGKCRCNAPSPMIIRKHKDDRDEEYILQIVIPAMHRDEPACGDFMLEPEENQ